MGRYSKIYWEYGTGAKASSVTVHTADLNAGNIVAQEALRAAFESAVDAVTLGNSGSEEFVASTVQVNRNPSLNAAAQRENKWLVSFADNVTGLAGSFSIPCYDSALIAPDGESMDTTAPEYAALITATEDFVRSAAGNTVTVSSVRFRARTI